MTGPTTQVLDVVATAVLPGDVLLDHEGRKVVSIERDDPAKYPHSVIITFRTDGAPCFAGIESVQRVVRLVQAEEITCPTCKRTVAVKADRTLALHLAKPGKPQAGACPSSALRVALVTGGRVR